MPEFHRDGPLTHDQQWKVYRLHAANWAPEYIARMFGRTEAEITAAIDACSRHLGATPPPEAA